MPYHLKNVKSMLNHCNHIRQFILFWFFDLFMNYENLRKRCIIYCGYYNSEIFFML
jgi:hypothetical protein